MGIVGLQRAGRLGNGRQMALAEDVANHFWWHSIDLGSGVVTPGRKPLSLHAREYSAIFDRVELSAASVVDIGAWNGAYSFEAKRRGAQRVLATDSYAWNNARFRGRETFELARSALGLDVEDRTIDLMEMTREGCGKFDVVLLLGVFYHLHDPIQGLGMAAALALDVLVVETHVDMEFMSSPAMAYYPGAELAGDPTNWWGPNVPLMIAMLRGEGFSRIDAVSIAPGRAIFHAWRSDRRRLGDPPADMCVPSPRRLRQRRLREGWQWLREALGVRRHHH
jgi:tRNA (mo5U34)-methyltransferase